MGDKMIKYKFLILIILMISIFTFNKVFANNLELNGKIIYVDPGHGGLDPGAIYKNVEEAPINLEISKKLVKALINKGATVFMTRYSDNDLSLPNASNHKKSDLNQRIKLINESNCDLYLSIHLNADSSENWKGAQVFYDDINEKNIKIATKIQKEFSKNLKSNRKVKEINDLYLYRKVKVPGVLLEVGFLSNSSERYMLKQDSYQEKIVNSIVNGVINYYNIP